MQENLSSLSRTLKALEMLLYPCLDLCVNTILLWRNTNGEKIVTIVLFLLLPKL